MAREATFHSQRSFFGCFLLLFLGITFPTLISCKRSVSAESDAIIVAIASDPISLDPRRATDATSSRLMTLLHHGLVKVGPTGELVADAARDWRWVIPQQTLELTLQPDLKFHDGTLVRGADIQRSFADFQKPDSAFRSGLEVLDQVTILSETPRLRVRVHLRNPSRRFWTADLPNVKILFAKDPVRVGSGPYRLESQVPGRLVLARFSAHPWLSPKTSRLVFKTVRDDATRAQKLMGGEVDLIQGDLPPSLSNLNWPDSIRRLDYPGLSVSYVLINHERVLLKDRQFREQLAAAIPRDLIVRFHLHNLAEPATGLLPPTLGLSSDPPAWPRSLGRLKGEFTLKTSSSRSAIENGQLLARAWREVGLNVQHRSLDWGTYYRDLSQGDFDLATMRWVNVRDPDLYRTALHSQEIRPGRNRGSYQSSDLDHLIDQLDHASSAATLRTLVIKIESLLRREWPVIPLWAERQSAWFSQRLQGYRPVAGGGYEPLLETTKSP